MVIAREYSIGAVARLTGCKVPTIRYFEQIGLLSPARRSPGGRRLFRAEHVERLNFIRNCRTHGFSQDETRSLLELFDNPDLPCGEVTTIAARRLETLKERMDSLSALIAELERIIEACKGGNISECRIIGSLATPSSGPEA